MNSADASTTDAARRSLIKDMIAAVDRAREAGLGPIEVRSTAELILNYARPKTVGPNSHDTIRSIAELVAALADISVSQLKGAQKSRDIAWPRQVAMMLCLECTNRSATQIGHFFNRDHTTVLHAAKAVEGRLKMGCDETANLLFEARRHLDRADVAETGEADAA